MGWEWWLWRQHLLVDVPLSRGCERSPSCRARRGRLRLHCCPAGWQTERVWVYRPVTQQYLLLCHRPVAGESEGLSLVFYMPRTCLHNMRLMKK
jgi:hypothetical protein